MVGYCEHSNGSLGSIKDGEILDNLSGCQILKNSDSLPSILKFG